MIARTILFGLPIDAATMDQAVGAAEVALSTRHRLLVGVVNAAKVVKLHHDDLLLQSLLSCDLLLADGQSVVLASRVLGRRLPERVAGIDYFTALLEVAERDQRRVYLLGAKQEVLDTLVTTIHRRWPQVVIAGARNGYFTVEESPQIATEIAAAQADMLFLGMTTPKKEIFLGRFADELDVPVLHGVGGSFDVLAGVTRRAPEQMQRLGLEWAYRLRQEPRRLWRRYLVTNSAFLLLLVKERLHPHPPYRRVIEGNH